MKTAFIRYLLVAILPGGLTLAAQTGANPFDLRPREKAPAAVEVLPVERPLTSDNPFDLVAPPAVAPSPGELDVRKQAPVRENQNPSGTLQEKYGQFIFGLVLFMLVLITVTATLFRPLLGRVYRAILNENMLSQAYRERQGGLVWPYLMLYTVFMINAGIFIFFLMQYRGISLTGNYLRDLLMSIAAIAALFIGKHILLAVIGFIFPVEKEAGFYSFTIVVYSIFAGLLLGPFSILLAYAPAWSTRYIFYVALGLIVLLYLVRSFRGLFIGNRFVVFHKFHFLLYICTIEVAPILVLGKLVISQLHPG